MSKFLSLLTLLLILTACQEAMVTPPSASKTSVNASPRATTSNSIVVKWPVNSATLEGEAFDPEGDQLFYTWALVSGKSDARIANSSLASTTVTNMSIGEYIFTLTVADKFGNKSVAETSISVIKETNTAPVANAGIDKLVPYPQTSISISGRGSDIDSDPLTYRWTLVKGNPISFSAPNSSSCIFSELQPGEYTLRLTVTDNGGLSHFDDTVITVTSPSNSAPIAFAGADQTITYPASSVALSGKATDANGDVLTTTWSKFAGGNSNFSATNILDVNVTDLQPGLYLFRLEAKDAYGGAHVDEVKVTVMGKPNTAPVANAGSAQSVTLPTNSIVLNGSGTDVDNDALTYLWTKISTLVAPAPSSNIVSATSARTSVFNMATGIHKFRLKVTDSKNGSSTSDVTITVNGQNVNATPVANAGPDKSIIWPTNSIEIQGAGTDSNNDALSYSWSKVSNTVSMIRQDATGKLSVSDMDKGTHTYRLTVKDIYGAQSTDEVNVKVEENTVLGGAPPTPVPGKLQIWTRNNPAETWYPQYNAVVFLPKGYSPTMKYPLIISLYGVGGRVLSPDHMSLPGWHEGFINQVWDDQTTRQQTFPAIVIAPEGRTYNNSSDVWWDSGKLKTLLDAALAHYSVDPDRVVVTGLSSGGAGTLNFVGTYPELFAGAMPLAMSPQNIDPCKYTFPLWVQGNADDGIFNLWAWNGATPNYEDRLTACPNYNDTFTLTWNNSGGHGGWDQFWGRADVQSWLTSRVRGQNPPH